MGGVQATPLNVLHDILKPGKIRQHLEISTLGQLQRLKAIEGSLNDGTYHIEAAKEELENDNQRTYYFLSVTYRALLNEEASTPSGMDDLARFCRDNNVKLKIGGRMCILDPFAAKYHIEQTIEGEVLMIAELFLKIKADSRVEEVTKVNFSFSTEREYPSWGMTSLLENGYRSSATNFLHEATKYKIMSQRAGKTSFLVEDVRTQKHYMLKEYTTSEDDYFKCTLSHANEVHMVKIINDLNDDTRGICPVPDIFYELVRVSIIYPIFQMDLFSLLENYTSLHHCEGLDPTLTKLYFMQMLTILKTLKRTKMIHRDIKPENFCIDNYGCLILIDFELALVMSDNNADNGVHYSRAVLCGTPLYLAPETHTDLMYSYQSDLWAVALTVCDMCSPETPFRFDANKSASIKDIKDAVVGKVAQQPRGMDGKLWALLKNILCDLEGRLTLEEVLQDQYFDDIRNCDPFDKHNPILSIVKDVNNKFGLVDRYKDRSVSDSFRSIQKLNSDATISSQREDHFMKMSGELPHMQPASSGFTFSD